MRVKEVKVSAHERFVICHNPEAATRDAAIRADLITRLEEMIDGSDTLTGEERGVLRGKISVKPGLNRFLRITPGGLLRVDRTKVKAEANLDGKYLLRSSDPMLSAEDIAIGYKQLLEVERGWRDMKSIIDLRPVYHRLEERIRAHVLLCWLALLLTWMIEKRHRPDLARRPPPPGPASPGHLRRPRRALLPDHRALQAAARPVRQARHHPAQADHRARPRITTRNDLHRLETRPFGVSLGVFPGHTPVSVSSRAELCGTQALRRLNLPERKRPETAGSRAAPRCGYGRTCMLPPFSGSCAVGVPSW
ncbi:hypothetical protein [Streptosporangium sp. NPDC087985]|uniref:IS1634 family transposase n=1 Tax=Streptosporangium sp. NPDC087985 TaxID=3366196 RepID=UPI0037F32E4C